MKLLGKYSLLFLAALLIFTSCGKDNMDEVGTTVDPPVTQDTEYNPLLNRTLMSSDGVLLDCFTVNFPFEMVDEDGQTYLVESEDDWNNLWDQDEIVCVDFVYPLNITDADGAASTIADVDALAEAFASCLPDGGWDEGDFPAYLINADNSCYELVYPISLVDINGETTVVNDEAEFNGAVAEELQFFVFPFNLLHEDGAEITVANIDEVFDALFSCSGWDDDEDIDWEVGFEYIGCYTIAFPLDVINGDGEVITVNNHMELCDLMITGELAGYAFPMTITDEDGNDIVVNNQDELDAAIDDCPEVVEPDESIFLLFSLYSDLNFTDCYTINYPITILLEDASSIEINNNIEFDNSMSNENIIGMVIPVSVTLTDGTVVELNNENDYFNLISGC